MNKDILIKSLVISFFLNLLVGFFPVVVYDKYQHRQSLQQVDYSSVTLGRPPPYEELQTWSGIFYPMKLTLSELATQFLFGWFVWWVLVLTAWFVYRQARKLLQNE